MELQTISKEMVSGKFKAGVWGLGGFLGEFIGDCPKRRERRYRKFLYQVCGSVDQVKGWTWGTFVSIICIRGKSIHQIQILIIKQYILHNK